jgi:cytochrome c oxidase cbb3-type subunit III
MLGRTFVFAAALLFGLMAGQPAARAQKPKSQSSEMEEGRKFLGLAPPADPAAADRGQKLFSQACSFCHGPNATGAEGPNLLRSSLVLHDDKGETLGPFLQKGRPEKGMPAFPTLPQSSVSDIAAFLHARIEAVANRFGYQLQNLATGNAERGKAYFNGAGGCSGCHSVTGDLAHIASKLSAPDLQAEWLYPSGRLAADGTSTPVPVKATVTLNSGTTVSGTLKRMDDFEITITDASGVEHSYPRSDAKVSLDDPLARHRALLAQYTDTDMHDVTTYLLTLK